MKTLRRRWWVGLIVLALLMVLPFSVSAATSTADIISIFNASLVGLVNLTRIAYCAAGVSALC